MQPCAPPLQAQSVYRCYGSRAGSEALCKFLIYFIHQSRAFNLRSNDSWWLSFGFAFVLRVGRDVCTIYGGSFAAELSRDRKLFTHR
uniref:Uncharacterized protein n=1 Tax=Anopheles arabiensis TaxID=7173 RepID=A0A182IFI5_ANOAR